MPTHEAFLQAIAADLYDDAFRLVYADWLDEHGDHARAEFIRLQCELEPIRDLYEIDRVAEFHRREEELLNRHRREWLGPAMEGWHRWSNDGASAEFRRGFVDTIEMPARTFLTLGEQARRSHPTIRRLVLFRVNGCGERLAASAALAGLAELELAGWYSDADAEALAASTHLARLQVLELWLGRRVDGWDAQLCRIMAASKAWPQLRKLVLLNPNDEEHESRGRLVAVANEAAGRDLAVYDRGWPERFPFAADFWYTFPGYLRDGRMAMAAEDHRTSPPTLCVLSFDGSGNQTDDLLTIALPDDLLAIPVEEWHQHKKRIRQHLIDMIGFRPGFIRIRDCRFPGDGGYDSPWWEVYSMQGEEERIGVPDSDDEVSWKDDPRGYAGQLAGRLREQAYVFGWDRFADKKGEVHST